MEKAVTHFKDLAMLSKVANLSTRGYALENLVKLGEVDRCKAVQSLKLGLDVNVSRNDIDKSLAEWSTGLANSSWMSIFTISGSSIQLLEYIHFDVFERVNSFIFAPR